MANNVSEQCTVSGGLVSAKDERECSHVNFFSPLFESCHKCMRVSYLVVCKV